VTKGKVRRQPDRKVDQAADELTRRVLVNVGGTDRHDVVCPREKTSMTPCIARDGHLALADDRRCVGCGADPYALLEDLHD
jgi:hypothetical protein